MDELARPMLRCARCGFVSAEPQAFIALRRRFRSVHDSYCRKCWREHFVRKNRRVVRSIGLALVVGIGVLVFTPRSPATETLIALGWLEVNVALMLLLWPLNVALHEFAHALTAKAVGMQLFQVHIGHGRALLRLRVAGIDVHINSMLFLGGLTYAGHVTPHGLRLRQAAYVAAGPAANLMLAGILVTVAGWMGSGEDLVRLVQGPAILQGLLLVNLAMGIASLFPVRVNTAAGVMSTDGMKLLALLRVKPGFTEVNLLNRWILGSSFAVQDEDYALAEEAAMEGLELDPEHPALLNNLGIAKLGRHEFEQGRTIFMKVLARREGSPQPGNASSLAESLNNVAYADLLIGGEDRLREALDYSRRACELVPREPGYVETRGCMLIEAGRYEEGRRWLAGATRYVVGVQAEAIHHAYLALADNRLGDAAAEAHLQMARRGSIEHPLLQRILARIEGADSALPVLMPVEGSACDAAQPPSPAQGPTSRRAGIGAVILGFLIAPSASGLVQGLVMRSLGAGIFVLPFAYMLALLAGIPGYLIFRRLGWLKPWQVILGGAGLGAAVASLLTWASGVTAVDAAISLYLLMFIVHGASVAAVFWWIAVRVPRSAPLEPQTEWDLGMS